jgi:predicted nucleotidyltransferase
MSAVRSPSREQVNQALPAAAAHYAELLQRVLGPNLVSVVLFGSVARGEAGPDSDIDLLLVGEEFPPGRFARLRLLAEVDAEFESELDRLRSRDIHPRLARILKTRAEAGRFVPLYLDLVEDARLLFDRDGFFQSVLARLGASLSRLGAERRRRGRTRYWVLKPDWEPGEVIEL